MKALVKREPKAGLWLQDIPEPEVGDNDVLIRVQTTAVCGTDVHIYEWDEWTSRTVPVLMTTGHKYVGHIEQLGRAVTGLKTGW